MKKIKKFQVRFSHPDIFGKRIVQDRVIFDTEEEAQNWIELVGEPSLKVEPVVGVMRRQIYGLVYGGHEFEIIEEAKR